MESSFYRASAAADPPAQKDTETNMKSGYSIKRELASINMSERVRIEALHDAGIGALFVDAIVWVCSGFERPGAGVFAKPSPKY